MGGWGHGQPSFMASKGWAKGVGQRGKRAGPRGHLASLVCFINFFKENDKLRKGLGKIIYSEKDGVIYLTQKMKDERKITKT